MRLYRLEIKRVLKSRRTIILLMIALVLSVLTAILPISFEAINRPNADGTVTELSGIEAIQFKKPYYTQTSGEVTPERMAAALREYQDCVREYGSLEEVPLRIYIDTIFAIRPLLRGLPEAFADPSTGMAADLMEIDTAEVEQRLYEQCAVHLGNVMRNEQRDHLAAQEHAAAMYAKVETPFVLYAGLSRDVFDYVELYILLLAILCMAMIAPLFSGEYQTGADSILRCAKYGRTKLAITKIMASCTILVATYIICIALHLLIINVAFGTECMQTSFQMLYSIINLPNFNMGQIQVILASAGLLSLLACVCCAMLISAKCKDSLTAMLISIVILLMPMLIYVALGANWIGCLLPSAGIGMQNNFLYQLINFNYLHIGDMSFWTPHIILTAAIIEIPIFLLFAIRSYCKHQIA